MILVTGATGTAGSQVVRALGERGAPVRAFVRDPGRARERLGDDLELAIGDFADTESVRAALAGADELVLSCADDPRRVEWETRAIDAAAAAGVRRIVKLSTTGAAPGAPVAFWDWHGRVEQHLRASGVPSVVLQSSFYMTNLLALAEHVRRAGELCGPVGEARIAMIDPRDVGAAAAAVLTGAGHDGRTYRLSGPEAITYADAADQLSAATGRPIEFVDVSPDVARHGILEAGLPEFVADQLLKIYAQLRQGAAADVTDAVHALTGSPPRSFADFARDYAQLFAPAGRETTAA
jgi:uncharacterized protein YbjT (DUF2867 family)